MNIILIAPPAGGKGTQASLICSKYNIPHISTGDLLRKEATNGNILVKELIEKGEFVSDDIIFELIRKCITSNECKNGYLLDGFPRNLNQAIKYDEMLEELGLDIGHVILLDIDKDLAAKRISGRRSCPNCGATYNIYFSDMKPIHDDVCDNCNIKLIKRSDDNEDTYNTRYNTYLEKTKPLIDYYINKGVLSTVSANGTVEETFKQINDIVEVIQ